MRRYVIVGNGVAGTTAAESIRQVDKAGKIDIFTDEPQPFYTRIRLPEYLAGEVDEEKLVVHKPGWYHEHSIELHLEEPVVLVDPEKREVQTTKQAAYPYDRLLLATGSHPFVPPVKGAAKRGVFTLRSLKDAEKIREYAASTKKAVLIGGGVLGLEVGNGLRRLGIEVSVVEFFPRLLPRQMDVPGSELLKRQMETMGFRFYLGARSKEIVGKARVEGVVLEEGPTLPCDMLLFSAGIRPNLDLARSLDLEIERGAVVNDHLETKRPGVYAAGDLVEHRGLFYGIWPASQKQGEIAGINMAGGEASYQGTVMSNRLKVAGIDLISSGNIDSDRNLKDLVRKDEGKFVYRRLVLEDGVIVGCILMGDISGHREILHAMENRRDVTAFKGDILAEGFDFQKLER
ncbi:MAG: NAD(P)/FAD-dependent oxidoreductase [Deltaproteobacteria bacterium]|nr:NAD(P)/FAD-dependent oxidoreductase [Deltaproteobacteria bacterium]